MLTEIAKNQPNINTPQLDEYQKSFLAKIEASKNNTDSVSDRWLGFLIQDHYYATPITLIKEVLLKPEEYVYLGGWVSKCVKGAIKCRDELWAVYNGVKCDQETPHTEGISWEHHILLLNTDEVDGNIGIAVDKVFGAIPLKTDTQSLFKDCSFGIVGEQEFALPTGDKIVWRLWDPVLWLSEPMVKNISITSKIVGEKNV